MTLLELVIATSMLTMLLVSVSTVLRASRAAWEAHEADWVRLESAYATLRHIVRWLRQAESVTALSSPNDSSGYISIRLPNGDEYGWRHDRTSSSVSFGKGTARELLAEHIDSLTIEAFKADGTTPTTDLQAVQCFRITVGVRLPRDTAATRTVRSWVMMRAW